MLSYFANLSAGRQVLWCYLILDLLMAGSHFDSSPSMWMTALGISAIMGVALFFAFPTPGRRPDRWHVMRLFLIPFCVGSFSALVKGKGFILVFSPSLFENALALLLCATLVALCAVMRRL